MLYGSLLEIRQGVQGGKREDRGVRSQYQDGQDEMFDVRIDL